MDKNTIKKFLQENRGYLKWGKNKLAKKFNTSARRIQEVKQEINEVEQPTFRRMFFDIETSYNIGKFWRTGYNLNINPGDVIKERAVICISWKFEGEDKVYNLKWDKNQCDKEMLKEFSAIMSTVDEAVAHNGDRFDIKWLRTRCLMHDIYFPTYVKSFDTLKKVRSMFNFQSNKLDYIANVLGFGNKLPTSMKLWDDIILNRCPKAMKTMVEYCDHDVILLEDVYRKIMPYTKAVTHVGVSLGKSKCSCPNCGEEDEIKYIKPTVTAAGTIKRHIKCETCETDYIVSDSVYKKFKK